jgi:predicted DNA-binding transcriptional regulator AlpA
MPTEHQVYLTDLQVAERYVVSRPTVWRWVRIGRLPPPVSIGPNTRRWLIAALDAWDAERQRPEVRP